MNAVIETPVGTQLLSRPADRMAMRAIFNELRDHHSLFTILASSEIIADDKYPFAYITMSGARARIGLNYEWWLTRNDDQRKFVLVHEGLHFMFGHLWQETVEYVAPPNERKDNWKDVLAYAVDLMVNSATQRVFRMQIDVVDPEKRFVWAETLFQRTMKSAQPSTVEWSKFLGTINQKGFMSHAAFVDPFRGSPNTLRTWYAYAEWLMELAAKKKKRMPKSAECQMHLEALGTQEGGGAPALPGKADAQQAKEYLAEKMKDKAFKQSMEVLRRGVEGNTHDSAASKAIEAIAGCSKSLSDLGTLFLSDPMKLAKAWTSMVRTWQLTCLTNDEKYALDWTRPDTRFALVTRGNAILPREIELDPDIKKTSVLVYLDFSGSCAMESMGFLLLALTIPLDRFDVRFFAFGTKVVEMSREYCEQLFTTRVYPKSGAGTDFQAVANHVHAEKNVRNVFVLTDGDAEPVQMKEPRKWSWLQVDNTFKKDLGWAMRQGAHHGWITFKEPKAVTDSA